MTSAEKLREPYQLPEYFVSMTIHHLYGIGEAVSDETVDGYMAKHGYTLMTDLLVSGLSKEDIESCGKLRYPSVAHWPAKEPQTDFFWSENEETKTKLTELADKAVGLCFGQDEHQPVGGTFASVCGELGSQQLAIVGLIYGREQGRLQEFPEFDNGAGPVYVVRGVGHSGFSPRA